MAAKTYEELAQANPIAADEIRRQEKEDLRVFRNLFPVVDNGKNWPDDAAHENGNYQCKCGECGESFIGHKRRVRCKECS